MAATAAAAAPAPDAEKPAQKSGKRRLILLAVPMILVGIGAGLWFSGVLPRLLGRDKKTEVASAAQAEGAAGKPADGKEATPKEIPAIDLPDLIANLNVAPGRPASFVKLHVRIELARPEDVAIAKNATARLQDLFQTYLREMRPDELRGSEGTWRLREEMLARANIAIAPARATDVLFTEMLVQ